LKLKKGGDFVELVGKSGRIWGAAFKSTTQSIQPLIVSTGHRISLPTALKVLKACITKYKIAAPVILVFTPRFVLQIRYQGERLENTTME